jgi:hypothetical protein
MGNRPHMIASILFFAALILDRLDRSMNQHAGNLPRG